MENIQYTIGALLILLGLFIFYHIINNKPKKNNQEKSTPTTSKYAPLFSMNRCECGNQTLVPHTFCDNCLKIFKTEYSKFNKKKCFCGCGIVPGSINCSIHLQQIIDRQTKILIKHKYYSGSNISELSVSMLQDRINKNQKLLDNYFNNLNQKQNMENNFEFKEHKEPVQEALDAVSQVEQEYKGNKNQHIPMVEKSRLTGSDFDKLYAAGGNTQNKPKSELGKLLDKIFSVFKHKRDNMDDIKSALVSDPSFDSSWKISDDRKSVKFKVPVGNVSMNDAIEILQNQKDNFDAEFQWNKDTNELQIYQDPNKIVDVDKLADGGKRLETLKKAIESGAAYIDGQYLHGEGLDVCYPLKVQSAGNYGISANENGGLEINPIFKIEHKNPIYLANFHIDENGILKHGLKYNDLETHPGFSEAILTHEEVDQTKDTDAIQQKQYDLRSFRTDRNNFEWSEKVYQDTAQFFASILGPEKFERWGNVADDGHPDYNPELYKSLDQLIFPVGTKLQLEVEVTNIWFSRMLSMWLYGQSEYSNADISKDVFVDNKFEPMGLYLHNVNWHGLHTLNDFERDSLQTAINIIQSKLNKDNTNKNIKVTL